jgi:thiol-disulfide isomerase/thioredoxin
MELAELDYVKARLQFLYPIYARVDQDSLFVEELKNPLKGINMNDEKAFIQSSVYENMRSAHLNISISRDTSGTYEENFQKYIAALPSGNIKNTLLYNTMQFLMGPNEQKEEMYTFFNAHNTDEDNAQAMKEKYEELEVLNPGNPSPVFDYENHAGGKTKLDDLKGKYVYIDVWATWCGPCLREIPSLKKVEEEYHDKNIDFVSISIDDLEDHQKWVDMVNNKELGGVQLMADNAWQSDFVQDYKISGIPRFILLDPEGKIVSADAPRPSNEALIEKFNDLGI